MTRSIVFYAITPFQRVNYELVQPLLAGSPEAFLLVNNRVQRKRYSRFIEVAKRQYSGNVYGLVNLVHRSGESGNFLPPDFRL